MNFFRSPQEAPAIDTANLMCVHGKMDLEKVGEAKVVASEVVSELKWERLRKSNHTFLFFFLG